MPTPGCLFLRGKPVGKRLTLETFVGFVSETVIPAIAEFIAETAPSSQPLILRYESTIPGSAFPCIVLVRLDDVAVLQTRNWKQVVETIEAEVMRVGNELIETGEHTEWKARVYELSQRFEGQIKKPGKCNNAPRCTYRESDHGTTAQYVSQQSSGKLVARNASTMLIILCYQVGDHIW